MFTTYSNLLKMEAWTTFSTSPVRWQEFSWISRQLRSLHSPQLWWFNSRVFKRGFAVYLRQIQTRSFYWKNWMATYLWPAGQFLNWSIIFLLFVSCIFVQTITFSHLIFRMISGQESRNMYSKIITFFDVFRMVFILHTICYKADELKDEVCTFHKWLDISL